MRKFGCAAQVPIPPPKGIKMGPQRRLRIYVGCDSFSIIRYLEPMTGDVFIARFSDRQFNKTIFPPLEGDKIVPEEYIVSVEQLAPEERRELIWNAYTLSHLDSRTSKCENEVWRIVHLQEITNILSNAFNDSVNVTKSHVLAMNAPVRISVIVGQS